MFIITAYNNHKYKDHSNNMVGHRRTQPNNLLAGVANDQLV